MNEIRKFFGELLRNLGEQVIRFAPNLVASGLLLALGIAIGWFVKRVVIRVCVVFRLHRYLPRLRWRQALSKADVRYALFNYVGNLAFALVFLIFLYSALIELRLTAFSSLLQEGIFFLPRLIGSVVIFAAGLFFASRIAVSTQVALFREGIPRATLIGRFVKGSLALFFSAMALTVLNVAREVVVIGFAVSFATLGAMAVVAAALGGKGLIRRLFEQEEGHEQRARTRAASARDEQE